MDKEFPFTQVIVVGGTGQTGHRVVERLVELAGIRIVATSRGVRDGMPAGPLASTIAADAIKWGSRVSWAALDLEADEATLRGQLATMKGLLDPAARTALVFAAAFTNVDGCENDPEFCARVNEKNTTAVLYWAHAAFKARLVFYSTDYVFNGTSGPYSEDQPRQAVQVYGRAKVYVEEWLERTLPDALIVRTTGVFDYLAGSKNFLMQMLELWGQGKTTRIPSDQFGNPVWACDLARATLELLARGARGIYHVGGGAQLARVEFARQIGRIFGANPELIVPVETKDLAQKAIRPLRGGLLCDKLERELGWRPRPAAEILESLKWHHK